MGSKNKNNNKQKSKAERPDGAAAAVVGQNNEGGRGGKMISDPRFASVHLDPRFREAPRQKSKVVIDSRFNRMLTDKNFTSSKAQIDKRGKQRKDKDASRNKLKHYYRLEEEEAGKDNEHEKEDDLKKKHIESEEESEKEESESEESESESESESEDLKKKASKVNKISKSVSESESESGEEDDEEEEEEHEIDDSSTSTTDSDEDEDGAFSDDEDTFMQPEENVPEIEKETHRLAVVNMDWSQVKAVDLFVLLSSFLPKEGQIKSVTVYPSEFGLQRMEEEAVRGPVGLFDDDKEDDDDDDDEIDEKKLRAYELSKLRYYFAVVDCDSIATADYLYKTCDGVEFERSAVKLDLRFIPDSMEFKHQPRDVATEAPASYDGLDFQTRALQQSKVHISWDEDEPQRVTALKRKFNDDQLAELELKEFLASDESETDGDDGIDDDVEEKTDKKHKKQDRYRALLESGNGSGGSDEEDGEGDQDMEVTFNTGLEDLSKRILEKKDKKSETVWEAHLRKMNEKKKARKNKSKYVSDDESSDTDEEPAEQPDDFFIEEPTAKSSSKKAGKTTKQKGKQNLEVDQENEASKAELELLFLDDNGADSGLKGYNIKPKKTKGKKGKEVPDEEKIPVVDYNDPRFSALFTSPLFAKDPTDPQFKRSATYARQLAQKQQKTDVETASGLPPTEIAKQSQVSRSEDRDEHLQSGDLPSKNQKYELSSLVRSIKMKSKQVPLPPVAKKSGSQPATKKRKQ